MSDLIALADAHCTPRKGSEHKLNEARVRELMPQVPGWELAEDGHALVKTFKFPDYYRTMVFAVRDEGQCVHEAHRPVVVGELEGLHQRVAILRQFPARNLRQQLPHAGFGELVLAALAWDAVGVGEGDEVGHGAGSLLARGG